MIGKHIVKIGTICCLWVTVAAGPGDVPAQVSALHAQDQRVAAIGYRLASRAAGLCPASGRPAGLLIQTGAQYAAAYRGAAAAIGIGDDPSVAAIVPGSPAAAAGLAVGDRILAIDGAPVAAPAGSAQRASYQSVDAVLGQLDLALADGSTALSIARGGTVMPLTLSVPSGCRARFDVRAGRKLNASSNGVDVLISSELVDFAVTDDELAAAVAHELAHNILGHAALMKQPRHPPQRDIELAADRLSIYLLALADYPFANTLSFWTRFGRATDMGIFSDRTHPGSKQRIAAMTVERARIDALRAQGAPIKPPPELLP